MKYLFVCICFLFMNLCFADGTFAEAEKLFENGSYFEAEKILNEYIRKYETEKSKNLVRARAMLEYIARKNPENRESVLKKYQTLAEAKKIDPDRILAEIPRGMMFLKVWKNDGVPKWIDLAQSLLILLDRAESKGAGPAFLKLVYYRAEVLLVRGDAREGAKQLENAVSHYYSVSTAIEKLSAADRLSIIRFYSLLGDAYTAIAAQTDEKDEKVKYHSLAGSAWLKIYPALEKNTVLRTETVQKLRNCAETLALLGRRLKLPAELLKIRRNEYYPLIRKMLEEKRCSGAGKVIEQELAKKDLDRARKSELLALRLASLGGLEKYAQCAAFLQRNSRDMPVTPEFLAKYLNLAGMLSAFGSQEDAYAFFSVLAAMPYQTRDLENILFQCANLAVKCGKTDQAKKHFEKAAELAETPVLKQQAFFQAAQCAEQIGDHAEAFRLAGSALRMDIPGNMQNHLRMLHLQSAVRIEKYETAASDADLLLAEKDLDRVLRGRAFLLAAIAAEKRNKPADADRYLTGYLTENPDAANYFPVLAELKRLRLANGGLLELTALCELALVSHNDAEETYRLILELGDFPRKKNDVSKSLKIYRNLLKINIIAPDKLMALSHLLSSGDFKRESWEADDIARKLLAKHLPEYSDDPRIRELYFSLAKLYFHAGECTRAVHTLNHLLSEQRIYRMEEVLSLYAQILEKQGKWPEAANVWRRLFMTGRKSNRLEIIRLLAFAEMKSGHCKRAVATAFLAIPADGKLKRDERENQLIFACLDILLKSAKEANLTEDYNEALQIKEQMERE